MQARFEPTIDVAKPIASVELPCSYVQATLCKDLGLSCFTHVWGEENGSACVEIDASHHLAPWTRNGQLSHVEVGELDVLNPKPLTVIYP